VTEQQAKTRDFTKDVLLGWVLLCVIIAMAIMGFQLTRERGSNDILDNPGQIPRISASELKSKMASASNLIVVDVRSKKEYEEMHIVGSISLPSEEISQRFNDLQGYKLIVTYCT